MAMLAAPALLAPSGCELAVVHIVIKHSLAPGR